MPAMSGASVGRGASTPTDVALPIDQIDFAEWVAVPTGLPEVDRVLGGGLVPGSVTLVHGEPGIGKSTLLLQIVRGVAEGGRRALYLTAEESKQQVRLRAERLGTLHPELWLASETGHEKRQTFGQKVHIARACSCLESPAVTERLRGRRGDQSPTRARR